MLVRLVLNSRSAHLGLQSAWITGVSHHARLIIENTMFLDICLISQEKQKGFVASHNKYSH